MAGLAPNNYDPTQPHTSQQVDAHIKQCQAEAKAAQQQQPSPAPNGYSLLTGLFTGGINLLRGSSPQVAAISFTIGTAARSLVNYIAGMGAYNGTLDACLNNSSAGGMTGMTLGVP